MKFLFPWQGFLKTQLGSVLKSVMVGLVSTAFLIVLGWSFFSSSEELNDRRPISVMIDPDFRLLPARKAQWEKTGTCQKYSIGQPEDGQDSPFIEWIECRNWQQKTVNGELVNYWTATEYTHRAARDEMEFGSTRLDAVSEVIKSLGRFGENLLVPIGIFSAVNFGVSIGIWFRKRYAKTLGPKRGV